MANFHNPYSKYPDIAQGLNDFLQMMMMWKVYQQMYGNKGNGLPEPTGMMPPKGLQFSGGSQSPMGGMGTGASGGMGLGNAGVGGLGGNWQSILQAIMSMIRR